MELRESVLPLNLPSTTPLNSVNDGEFAADDDHDETRDEAKDEEEEEYMEADAQTDAVESIALPSGSYGFRQRKVFSQQKLLKMKKILFHGGVTATRLWMKEDYTFPCFFFPEGNDQGRRSGLGEIQFPRLFSTTEVNLSIYQWVSSPEKIVTKMFIENLDLVYFCNLQLITFVI